MITLSRPHFESLQSRLTQAATDRANDDRAFLDMLANCRALQAENEVLKAVLNAQDQQLAALRATIITLKGKG